MACSALLSLHSTLPHPSLRQNPTSGPNGRIHEWLTGGVKPRFRSRGVRAAATEQMGTMEKSWIEFPRLSPTGKKLMETAAALMDRELGDSIKPSETPPDVRSFQGQHGEGSVVLRAGQQGSKVDFVLGSWLKCTLPFGTLNSATLTAIMGPSADSPHLVFDYIQNAGSESLVLVLDLVPRKDLVLHPEYLARFYENTPLESVRQAFEKHPVSQPYLTSSLYVRTAISPTALLYKINGEGVEGGLDAVVTDLVQPAVMKVLETWVQGFKDLGEAMDSDAMAYMKKRDDLIKTKVVEIDMGANMPRLFGDEIADRVIAAFRRGV
ncbi:hypothetical protein M758_1G060700 [Ceratodon purpureus]|nr:hypothetical protein M758_1G060700 [Ceratodon purpureus]